MKSKYVFAFCNSFLKIVSNVGARKMPPGKMLPGKVPPGSLPPEKLPPSPLLKKKYFMKLPHVMQYLNGENFVNFNFCQS